MPVDPAEYSAALRQYAAGVVLLTVRDDIDDVGTTVTSVMSASASTSVPRSSALLGMHAQ